MVMHRLAGELRPGRQRRMTLIGGVAMALGYRSRRTTTDADAIIAPADAEEILAAAARIAPDFQLDAGWLNQKAIEAGKILAPRPETVVLETPTLVLEVPSCEAMLAMKLARGACNSDLDDARLLLHDLRRRYADVEALWTVLGGLVPVAQLANTRYNLLKQWEDLDESP